MATYTSQYPPSHDSTYVKATSITSSYPQNFQPHFATDPAKSLTSGYATTSWSANAITNQKFNIDLGSAYVVRRVYIENSHSVGGFTNRGIKNVVLYGTNSSTAFANVTYGDLTDLVELATFQVSEHVAADTADPQYFLVANDTAYQYYVLSIADNYGGTPMNLRHVALQTEDGWTPGPSTTPIRNHVNMLYGDMLGIHRVSSDLIYSLLFDRRAYADMIYSLRLGAHIDMRYGDCPELRSVLNMHYSDCPLLRRALVMSYDDLLMHRHSVDMPYSIPRTLIQTMEMRYSIAGVGLRAYSDLVYDLLVNNPLRAAMVMPYMITGELQPRAVETTATIGGRTVRCNHLAIEPEWGLYAIPVELHLTRESDYAQVAIGEDVVVVSQGVTYNLVVDDKRDSASRDTGIITWIVECLSPAVRLSADYADPVETDDSAGLHGTAKSLVIQLADGFSVAWNVPDFPVLPYTLYPNGDAPFGVIEKILAPQKLTLQSEPDGSLRVEQLEPDDWETREPDYYITWGRDFISQDTTHIKKPGYNVYLISNAMESENRLWTEQRAIRGNLVEVLCFKTPWNAALAELLQLEHSGGSPVPTPEYLGVVEEVYPPADEPAEQVEFVAGFGQVQRPIYDTRLYSHPVGGAVSVHVDWLREHLGAVTHAEDGRLEAEIKDGSTDGYSLAAVRYLTRYHLWRVRDDRDESVQYLVRRLDDEVVQ